MWGPKRLNLLWFLRYGFPQMARYYHSMYLLCIFYLSTLNIHRSIYRCWQGKFPEYTHFVETSSTGCRDMLGHFGGKLCHRERGRCLARHQISSKTARVVKLPLSGTFEFREHLYPFYDQRMSCCQWVSFTQFNSLML